MSTALVPSVPDTALIFCELRPKRRESALRELVERAHAAGAVAESALLCETLLLREKLACSALGKGVAVPHTRSLAVLEPRLVVGRSARGITWGAPDERPVHLVLLTLSPPDLPESTHLELVERMAAVVRPVRQRTKLLEASDDGVVAALFREALV